MAWGNDRAWSKGSTRQWRNARAQVLGRDARRCQLRGPECTGIATEVHHLNSKAEHGSDDPSNLLSTCPDCHTVETLKQAAAGRANRTTKRPTARHPGHT